MYLQVLTGILPFNYLVKIQLNYSIINKNNYLFLFDFILYKNETDVMY